MLPSAQEELSLYFWKLVYQLRNSQEVNIKQYFRLSQMYACSSFLSSSFFFLSAVFGNGLLVRKVWEWPFYAIMATPEEEEDYKE